MWNEQQSTEIEYLQCVNSSEIERGKNEAGERGQRMITAQKDRIEGENVLGCDALFVMRKPFLKTLKAQSRLINIFFCFLLCVATPETTLKNISPKEIYPHESIPSNSYIVY